ncbi:MAG: DUF1015 family protein, partial [Polyangiaceae bacterium]
MSLIAPLSPLRYDLGHLAAGLASVVAPPYDVISSADRVELALRDPHNVVRLILPEAEVAGDDATSPDARYKHAAELLSAWRKEGVLVRDSEPAFYRYEQTFIEPGTTAGARATRRGFLGLVRLATYAEKKVLPHERTLSGP